MSTDLTKPKSPQSVEIAERPDWIPAADGRKGLDELARIIRPSMVKIIQAPSASELKKQFGEGSLILTPDMIFLTNGGEEGAGAKFAPILFYTEWCKWTGFSLKGIEPMIADRSFDPKSQIAVKSQSAATWSEPHPSYPNDPQAAYRYCEHFNFIVKLLDDDLLETPPVLVSFVKSSYMVGQMLGRLAMKRKAPIYAGQYKLGTKVKKEPNEHWVFTVTEFAKDSGEQWVPKEIYDALAKIHDEYDELLKQRRILPDYEELGEGGDASFDTDKFE